MKHHTFHMTNDLADLDRAILSMKTRVEGTLGTSSTFKFELGVTEALSNLIKHAHANDPAALIQIIIWDNETNVVVEIFDPIGAQSFDPRDHAKSLTSVDPLAESGRGLGLILQCADHIDYGRKADRMCLSLTFLKSGD